jgi:predicted RNA binding protein YcfA (HicA-like mRNA interferase family)
MPRLTPVSSDLLAKVFVADGWIFKRTKGDHACYTKPGYIRPVVIPQCEVGVDVIMSNLRTAKMTRERFFELLGSV